MIKGWPAGWPARLWLTIWLEFIEHECIIKIRAHGCTHKKKSGSVIIIMILKSAFPPSWVMSPFYHRFRNLSMYFTNEGSDTEQWRS